MRVTFNMRGMQMKDMLATSLSNYTEAVKKANAKQGLLNPWEDTSKYVGAYNMQNMIDELTQFGENAGSASNWLNNTNAELQELVAALKKARDDYAVAGSSDSYDEEDRKALAKDVMSLYQQIMDIANAQYNGRYIFGGHQTEQPPFSGGTSSVSNVITKNENGESLSGNAITKEVYSDMRELASGKYTAKIKVENGIAKLSLYDDKGNVVILDSNGSDESGGQGNNTSVSMTFPYEPGKVVNTGRGISFQMPEDLDNPTSIVMEFNYKSGSEITYNGDNGYIHSQIGYNQDIPINMPGSNIFTQAGLILQGGNRNTVNGLPANLNTLFSQLDNTNIGIGDSIKVSGTDHNGNKVGIANLIGTTNADLDLSSASEKERTLTVTYGDKLYKVVVPQKAYNSTDELANAINNELKNAEYLGSISGLDGVDANMDDYQSLVDAQVKSGNFPGAAGDEKKLTVDLSNQIKVGSDGGRLNFKTAKAGDNVRLAVTGTDQSKLGFKDHTVAAVGKDTTFEIGYDFSSDTIKPVQTTHKDFNLSGTSYTFFVNGKEVVVNKPATTITTASMTALPFGTDDVELNIGGKKIVIAAKDFNGAQDKQAFLNEQLQRAGLGGEAAITAFNDNGDGTYNINVTSSSPSKKELEYAFDQALKEAGFDFEVGVSLDQNPIDPAKVGTYDITFSLQNYNMDRDTSLTTTAYDRNTIPPTSDMKTADLDRSGMNAAEEKTLGDYVNFIKELYGEAVDVSIVDGKLTIADLRSGESKLTFRTNAQNQGISHANDQVSIVGGAYTGVRDDTWNVSVTTELGLNNQRNITITIQDKQGNTIYNEVTEDYKGGPIQLPNGVTITPDDMEIPNPLDPTKRTATTTFQIDLKAEPGLTFGDIGVIETGKNVNIFDALDNLINALEYNITKNGFGEPSAWKATDLNSSAKPYFDGVFQGNFNDLWKYEILSDKDKTDFYLQNEFKNTTGTIKYDETMFNTSNPLTFGIDVYDNKTGKVERVDVNIDFTKAKPPVTDEKSAQKYILEQLNNDKRLVDAGVKFTNKDGAIEIQSGSGTKIANFANTATDPRARAFASYVMGFDTVANGKMDDEIKSTASFTFRVADPLDPTGAGFKEITVTPTFEVDEEGNPKPLSKEDLLKQVNAALADQATGTDGRVKAIFGKDGSIQFVTADTDIPLEATVETGADNPLKIGLTHDGTTNNIAKIAVSGVQAPKTDLSELDEAARTLTFKYIDANGQQKKATVILDKKAYGSTEEMAADINKKLAEKGIPAADLQAAVNANGELSFMQSNNNIRSLVVEGDHAGSLGFPKAGDSVSVKVTGADGGLVQTVSLDTAGKSVFVSDGLQLGFDAGSLNATDSFTAGVGSGLESQIDILDAAVDQALQAATVVGTRGQRVESVLKFQETVIMNSENKKAEYLGATAIDVVKLTTEAELALTAYKSAIEFTSKMMSISILDFLG